MILNPFGKVAQNDFSAKYHDFEVRKYVYGYEFDASEAASQSPDQAPLSPTHAPEYPEYLAPSDDDLELVKAQPLPAFTPLPPFIDTLIEEWHIAPTPSSPSPSPLSPLSSPLPMIPSPPLLLPPPTRSDIILEADMPPQKRARFSVTSHRFEIRESSAATAARQPRSALARVTRYGFVATLEANKRVIDLATEYEAIGNNGNDNENGNKNGNGSHNSGSSGGRTNVRHDTAYRMPWKTLMNMMKKLLSEE
nr:hypothetical protein [Tanacetum cinerariifolium]